jgi:hypothetical protein
MASHDQRTCKAESRPRLQNRRRATSPQVAVRAIAVPRKPGSKPRALPTEPRVARRLTGTAAIGVRSIPCERPAPGCPVRPGANWPCDAAWATPAVVQIPRQMANRPETSRRPSPVRFNIASGSDAVIAILDIQCVPYEAEMFPSRELRSGSKTARPYLRNYGWFAGCSVGDLPYGGHQPSTAVPDASRERTWTARTPSRDRDHS